MFIKDSFNYEIKKYFNKNYQYWYQASWTAASAGLGSLITEAFFDREPKTFIINILQVGLWFGIIGAFILIGVYISQKKLQHLNVDYLEISKEVIFPGFCAGFCAGSIAQILFSFYQTDLNKIICWGVAGLILAYIISKKFKNVDIKSCTIYGALGGVIGGFLFILISNIITDVMGRLIGISLIGLSI